MTRRLFFLLLVMPVLMTFAQSQTGTVRGIVVREGTGDPIPDVQVSIGNVAASAGTPVVNLAAMVLQLGNTLGAAPVPAPPSTPDVSQLTATTDAGGRFVIQNVPAGQHVLTAVRENYFGVAVNGVFPGVVTASVRVVDKQPTEMKLTMVPGAAISGRITGPNGMPVTEATVEVLRMAYQNGEAIFQAAGSRQTDDRGEYRLYRIPPGEYLLGVSLRTPGARGTIPNAAAYNATINPQALPVRTFYPNATTIATASKLTVAPADEIRGMDIQIQTVVGATVSGRVASQLPSAPQPATVTLVPRDRNTQLDARLSLMTVAPMGNNGVFQIPNVPSGEYDLFATLPSGQLPHFGRTSVSVRAGNVDGITVAVQNGVDIQGKILIDGKASTLNIPVSLQPIDAFAAIGPAFRSQQTAAGDGSFLILAVPEAQYRVQIGGGGGGVRGQGPAGGPPAPPAALPAGAYLADIRQGAQSIYDDGFRVGLSQVNPIEVLINGNGGTIQGTVIDSNAQPVPSAIVVLAPALERRKNPGLYKTSATNGDGAFNITAVPPGQYKLFAWTNIPVGAHQNAEFMKQFEEKGVGVTVAGAATINQRLSVIR